MSAVIHSPQHNILHNELINNGWSVDSNSNINSKKFVYKYNTKPYDEFILDYISSHEITVTVPIPYCSSSIAYRNIFEQRDIQVIQDYLKMHLSNNGC